MFEIPIRDRYLQLEPQAAKTTSSSTILMHMQIQKLLSDKETDVKARKTYVLFYIKRNKIGHTRS